MRFRHKQQTSASAKTGKIGATLFGLFFMGMGLLFVGFILFQTVRNVKALSWKETPCTITRSTVQTVSDGYAFEVEYAYRVKGKTYHSRQFKPGTTRFTKDDVTKADRLSEQYPTGTSTVCYVNSANPSEAVLKHGSLWIVLVALFPMIFVVIGGGIIYGTWTESTRMLRPRARSEKATQAKLGRKFLAGFFLIFFFAGIGTAYFMVLPELIRYLDSDNWVKTPCVVQSSRVQSHDSDDSTTYSVDIVYQYEFNGRHYRSGKYKFIGGSSSGYSGKAAVVRQYPSGKKTVCYVDPNNPADAVLKRELGPEAFLALIPVLFMVVGLSGAVYFIKGKKSGRGFTNLAGKTFDAPVQIHSRDGKTVLKPKTSAAGKIIGSIVVSVFWNGIVSVFVFQAYSGWKSGHPEYFLTIFLIPFVLVGLAMIGSIFYFLMAAFNPKPVMTLSKDIIRLGDTVPVTWETSGNVYKIQNFKLTLIGEESATYRRGTSTYTDTNTFYDKILIHSPNPESLHRGETQLTIPAQSMHSFKSDNNAIIWKISLHCDIPRWPDIKENFEIRVHPMLIEEF